jgi:hypothetical protein
MPSQEALLAQILARLNEIVDMMSHVYEEHEGIAPGAHIHVYDTGRGPNAGAPHHKP